jgi:hypothetical protein
VRRKKGYLEGSAGYPRQQFRQILMLKTHRKEPWSQRSMRRMMSADESCQIRIISPSAITDQRLQNNLFGHQSSADRGLKTISFWPVPKSIVILFSALSDLSANMCNTD